MTEHLPDFAAGWVFRAQAEEACGHGDRALASLDTAKSLECDEDLNEIMQDMRSRLT